MWPRLQRKGSLTFDSRVRWVKTMDPTYPLVPIANFIACALAIIPLHHMVHRSWNTGVYIYLLCSSSSQTSHLQWEPLSGQMMIMIKLQSGAISVSLLRNKSFLWIAKLWLEASHLIVLVNAGIPACSFVITRRLYKITRLRDAMVSRRQESGISWISVSLFEIYVNLQRLIELLLELAFCVGLPVIITGLCGYTFYQISRFLTRVSRLYCSRRPLPNHWRVGMCICRSHFRSEPYPDWFMVNHISIYFSHILCT